MRQEKKQQKFSYWAFPGRKEITSIVADHFNISVSDLKIRTRKEEIVLPRQLAMSLLIFEGKMSLSHIGRRFGDYDHATVLYALKQVQNMYQTNYNFKTLCDIVNNKTIMHPLFPFRNTQSKQSALIPKPSCTLAANDVPNCGANIQKEIRMQ